MAEQNETNNWTPEQLAFMRWLALPKKTRVPKTQAEFAKSIDVHPTTLPGWKHLPGFAAEVKKFAVQELDDVVPEIIAKMVAQALKGSLSHQQIILDMTDVYVQRSRQELTGKDGGAIQVEDAESARSRIARQLAKGSATRPAADDSGQPDGS